MELINKLFPHYALKRAIKTAQLENVLRAYEAGKPQDSYPRRQPSNNANEDVGLAGEYMRDRARYFDENLDIVSGLFDTLVLNIVGNSDPIRPLIRNLDGTLNTAANTAILRLWREWGQSPTVCGQYTILQALKLACRSWLRDGEFLTRLVPKNVGGTFSKIPFSLELIEADYLPFNKERTEKGSSNIIQGVELNKYSQAIAYHLSKETPVTDLYGLLEVATKRIPASEILHLKFTRRVHQVRGVTLLHSVMNRLDDLKDYEESERIAARVAAAMTGYIKKPGDSMGKTDGANRTFEMSPGMVFDNLLPGEEVGTIASNRPNPELINFRQSMLKAVAAGTMSNCSTISRDYNGTYSAQRQELLESKPAYEYLRQDFVDSYLGPIWRYFVKMGVVSGAVSREGIDPATIDDIEIRGIDIGWIDPQKQANAADTAVRLGVTTRGEIIRDDGRDPAAVFAEIKEEEEIFGPLIQEPEPVEETTEETTEEAANNASENEQD